MLSRVCSRKFMKTQSVHYKDQRGRADTHAKEAKKERNAKRKRGADDARLDPRTCPMDNARARNVKDTAEGRRAKLLS
jgi:hypothetical protein